MDLQIYDTHYSIPDTRLMTKETYYSINLTLYIQVQVIINA